MLPTYELYMQNDINTKGCTQWYYFSVINKTRGKAKLKIKNFVRIYLYSTNQLHCIRRGWKYFVLLTKYSGKELELQLVISKMTKVEILMLWNLYMNLMCQEEPLIFLMDTHTHIQGIWMHISKIFSVNQDFQSNNIVIKTYAEKQSLPLSDG